MRTFVKKHYPVIGALALASTMALAMACAPPPAPVAAPVPVAAPRVTHYPVSEEWVQVPARIYFDNGSGYLNDQARAMLAEAHATMAHRTDIVRIRIDGHTDPHGSERGNQRLSDERARTVMDYVVGTLGMPRELFEVHGYGSSRPLTSNTSEADRAQNRRVEFSMLVRRRAAP